MTREDYLEKREQLLNDAKAKLADNLLTDAENIKKEVVELDKAFAEEAQKRADEQALIGAPEVPQELTNTVTEGEEIMEKKFDVSSAEYKNAWLKSMQGAELTIDEQDVLTTGIGTEAGQSAVVPTTIINEIWDLVFGQHAILGDIRTIRANTVIDIPTHTASSGASTPNEGVAPSEETNTFASVRLAGKDYAKYVDISYAMEKMSIEALESYITTEIAAAIGEEMADDAITSIVGGIAADNKVAQKTGESKTDLELILKGFASLKRAPKKAVYTNEATLYGKLVLLKNGDVPVFQPSVVEGVAGTLLGAPIKIEDSITGNKILVGDPSKAVNGVVQDILIESDKDIKKHVTTFSGYARSEVKLVDSKAFAQVTLGE